MSLVEEFTNLFGIDETTCLTDLKLAYHSIALLAHPDKGGDVADMQRVAFLYTHAKKYLTQRDRYRFVVESDDLAEFHASEARDLESTCAECPSYAEIYEETRGAIDERFHRSFTSSQTSQLLLDSIGYGESMVASEYAGQPEMHSFEPYVHDSVHELDQACREENTHLVLVDHSSHSVHVDRMASASGLCSPPESTYEYTNYSHAYKHPQRVDSSPRPHQFENYDEAYKDAIEKVKMKN